MSKLQRPAKIVLPLLKAASFSGSYGDVVDRVYTWNPNISNRVYPWIEVRRLGGTRHSIYYDQLSHAMIEVAALGNRDLPSTEQLYEDMLEALYLAVRLQTTTPDGHIATMVETSGATQIPATFMDSWRVQGVLELGIRPPRSN